MQVVGRRHSPTQVSALLTASESPNEDKLFSRIAFFSADSQRWCSVQKHCKNQRERTIGSIDRLCFWLLQCSSLEMLTVYLNRYGLMSILYPSIYNNGWKLEVCRNHSDLKCWTRLQWKVKQRNISLTMKMMLLTFVFSIIKVLDLKHWPTFTCQGDQFDHNTTTANVSIKISEEESSVVWLTELNVGITENYSSQIIQDVQQNQSLDQMFKKKCFLFSFFNTFKKHIF